MALVKKEELKGILALYNPHLWQAGNRVYWIQNKPYPTWWPVTNVEQDCICAWDSADYEYDEAVRFEYTGVQDRNGFLIEDRRYLWQYNKEWRLFTLLPTKEELELPWD